MEYNPTPWAKPAIDFLINTERSMLHAEVGLGKTAIILTAIVYRKMIGEITKPTLVVAPKRVAEYVWEEEIQKWDHTKHLKTIKLVNLPPAKRLEAINRQADVYITNFEQLPSLMKVPGFMFMFDTLVVDEATRLASNRSHVSFVKKTGKSFIQFAGGKQAQLIAAVSMYVKFFVEATGTPCTDSLTKIWGQAWYCDGGVALERTFSAFQDKYFVTRRGSPYAFECRHTEVPDLIAMAIKPFTHTIMAKDWLDIADIREVVVPVKLSKPVMKVYDTFQAKAVIELTELKKKATKFEFLAAAQNKVEKLLQITAGFVVPQDEDGKTLGSDRAEHIHDEKLDRLEELIEEIDRPVIVAYYYKHSMRALAKRFNIRFVNEKDPSAVADWNQKKVPILGLHWQAGHGLNLQFGGCDIILYDLRWSGDQYIQLINRIGPARQKAAGFDRIVSAYSLVCKGTAEERVWSTLISKQTTEQAFMNLCKGEFNVSY
jgi:SNF2 family DNA or RNA helicase